MYVCMYIHTYIVYAREAPSVSVPMCNGPPRLGRAGDDVIKSLEVVGCTTVPCNLTRGTTAVLNVDLVSGEYQ